MRTFARSPSVLLVILLSLGDSRGIVQEVVVKGAARGEGVPVLGVEPDGLGIVTERRLVVHLVGQHVRRERLMVHARTVQIVLGDLWVAANCAGILADRPLRTALPEIGAATLEEGLGVAGIEPQSLLVAAKCFAV